MAPKKVAVAKKRARLGSEEGQGSGANLEPNFEFDRTNWYLFRDITGYENFIYHFKDRDLSEYYYFDKSKVTFRQPKHDQIMEYKPLELGTPPKLFPTIYRYPNPYLLYKYQNQQNPFTMSTWVCGKEISLSFENIAEWLELPNVGEKTYLLRGWTQMADNTADNYKKWFDRNNIGGASIYVSHMLSMHRLLFLFINNILIHKSTIKTNLEWGPMYYLRHLIQKDDKRFNIPYIILRHMQSAFGSKVAHLTYANIIHKIIQANGIEISSEQQFSFPIHLVDVLTRIGWVQVTANSGLMRYAPDQRDVNRWINRQNALSNQYWDSEKHQQKENSAQVPPYQDQFPQQFPMTAQFQLPQCPKAQIAWLCQQMHAQ